MRRTLLLTTAIAILIVHAETFAQSEPPPRIEVAGEFSYMSLNESGGRFTTDPGIGGRFTYNLNSSFALESSAYLFPFGSEVVGGLKAGKRFKTWGIFAKARPGFVSFDKGQFNIVPTGGGGEFPFQFETRRLTSFATDVGAGLEFYPSRRIVTRFDMGDTIIHFTQRTGNTLSFDPTTGTYTLIPLLVPSRTTHNFQFSASVGFRF